MIWVLLHHLTWQCNNKRQGRTELLDQPSELLRISSKFHTKKQTHLHFMPPNPQSDTLRSPSCNPFRYILRLDLSLFHCQVRWCKLFFPIRTLILHLGHLCWENNCPCIQTKSLMRCAPQTQILQNYWQVRKAYFCKDLVSAFQLLRLSVNKNCHLFDRL